MQNTKKILLSLFIKLGKIPSGLFVRNLDILDCCSLEPTYRITILHQKKEK